MTIIIKDHTSTSYYTVVSYLYPTFYAYSNLIINHSIVSYNEFGFFIKIWG